MTVIEAGPCPVVQVKTTDTDGYEAYQLAFEPVAERKVTKGELGHLKKAKLEAHRHLVEIRGVTEIPVGEAVTVEAFEPGEKVKVAGTCDRQGLRGDDQAPQFPPRPGVARIAQRPRSRARSAPQRPLRACSRARRCPAAWAASAAPRLG